MTSASQQLKDQLVQSRIRRERDQFIASIPEHQVLALASSYRDAKPCDFFDKPTRGSYNICYFVQFCDDLKWVIRVPLAPCLAFGAMRKLESEIATMQYVTEDTAGAQHSGGTMLGAVFRPASCLVVSHVMYLSFPKHLYMSNLRQP
jgi:hypothetical protein